MCTFVGFLFGHNSLLLVFTIKLARMVGLKQETRWMVGPAGLGSPVAASWPQWLHHEVCHYLQLGTRDGSIQTVR
jgi:hypothetical protein